MPSGDWQLSNAEVTTQGDKKPLRRKSKGDGRANVDLHFKYKNIFVGKLSGTSARGSTFTGAESNDNGIPDIVERAWKNHEMWIVNP